MQAITKEKRIHASNILFYIALFIELVLMIVEKSELSVPHESYIFRLTFLITLVAVAIMPHSRKEYFLMGLVIMFTFACYRLSGKNELLRFAVFVMAGKNIDLGKTMKAMFYALASGFGVIFLFALTGIMGQITMVTDYGRGSEEELRYVLGFGHPNTLWGCAFALMMLWLWVYGSRAKLRHFGVFALSNVLLYKLTVSRTAFMIGMFSFALALVVRYIPNLACKKWPYMLSVLVTPIFCTGFSVWAASVSQVPRYEKMHRGYDIITAIDELLNNRIHNLYRANNRHAGSIETWKLFSDRVSEEYFDMGWVRLFYWYGIIPTIIICLLVVVLIYACYRQKDLWTLVLILSLSIYTIIEATFVSVYIGRNFLLPVLSVYLGYLLERKKNVSEG